MSDRHRRLAYVAFYFPPTRASGVYRSRAAANFLAANGWDVTVITPQREFFRDYIHSYDQSLEATIDKRVRVERVRFSGELWETDIRRYSRLRAFHPEVWKRLQALRRRSGFPEIYAPWIKPALHEILGLHAIDPFDIVLATGNPHSSFAIASEFHRRTGVPYAVDYRDSWTLDLYREAPAFPRSHKVWRWERRFMTEASKVVFVNDAIRQWHVQRYPTAAHKMLVVENGWEPELLGRLDCVRADPSRPVRFGYIGTLTPNVPLNEFAAGWRMARTRRPMHDVTAILFGYLGYFRSKSGLSLQRQIAALEAEGISYGGPIPKQDVGAAYASIDALLLMIASSRYVTSGKVYEYMATGRPIVSIHDPACAASDLLRGYPLWFPAASLSPVDVAKALEEAASAARHQTHEDCMKARTYAAQFTRDAQLKHLGSAIQDVVDS